MKGPLKRLTYANVTATLALVIALAGGSAIAATTVGTAGIANQAVTTAKLRDSAVTSKKLAANAVTAPKVKNGAIGTPKLARAAVTADRIAVGALTADKFAAGQAPGLPADKVRVVVSATVGIAGTTTGTASARCDPTETVIGGGYELGDNAVPERSAPAADNKGWEVRAFAYPPSGNVQAFAICVKP